MAFGTIFASTALLGILRACHTRYRKWHLNHSALTADERDLTWWTDARYKRLLQARTIFWTAIPIVAALLVLAVATLLLLR